MMSKTTITIKLSVPLTLTIHDDGSLLMIKLAHGALDLTRDEAHELYLGLESFQHLFLPPEDVKQITRTT